MVTVPLWLYIGARSSLFYLAISWRDFFHRLIAARVNQHAIKSGTAKKPDFRHFSDRAKALSFV